LTRSGGSALRGVIAPCGVVGEAVLAAGREWVNGFNPANSTVAYRSR